MRLKGTPLHILVIALLLAATAAVAIFVARERAAEREQEDLARVTALRNATAMVTATASTRIEDLATALQTRDPNNWRGEFRRIGDFILKEPAISAIGLVRRVKPSERESYQRELGRTITSTAGLRLPERDEYMVIDDTISRDRSRPRIGVDVYSDPSRGRAIRAAIDQGKPVATEPLTLLSGLKGSVLYVPIFRANKPVRTPAQRRAAVVGLLNAGLRVRSVTAAVRELTLGVGDFRITDGATLVAESSRTLRPGGPSEDIQVAGRTWNVRADHASGSSTGLVLLIVGLGLAFTALVGFAMTMMSRRERYAGDMVERRTHELNVANAQLAEDARFFELTRDFVCTTDFEGNMVTFNDTWTEVLGWTREELFEMPLEGQVHPDDIDAVAGALDDLAEGGSNVEFTNRRLAKDGTWRWLEWTSVGVPDDGLIYASARDVTERIKLELELEIERAQMKGAQEIARLGSWSINLETGEMLWSDELFGLLGAERPKEALTMQHWLNVLSENDRSRGMDKLIATLRNGGDFEFEFSRHEPGEDGEPVYLVAQGFAERDRRGRTVRIVGTVADVTERRHYEHRLRFIADHDPLTELPNRRRFDAVFERHLIETHRYGSAGAVMMLDVDGLKKVNDEIGHAAGDALIKSVADAVSDRLRGADMCARIGGDEFVILLPRTDRDGAHEAAESLLAAVADPSDELRSFGVETVSASLGVVMIEDAPTAAAGTLLRLADEAMYAAKKAKRGSMRTYVPSDNPSFTAKP
ncbi:MAG: diguanylate cyclase [Solirubrobacterales bacterium]